ncbi:hypothetical protein I4F81_001374 [Pyropia yezoensis]|uniref:Uncharacterized protein n=1 Tax=Pyropia yezoensis TaxID=2788 RepID=A0ACC3BLI9_PYRYE|nr:hypothetical protein I4F81_001374 [Neopyropia yezoensis]
MTGSLAKRVYTHPVLRGTIIPALLLLLSPPFTLLTITTCQTYGGDLLAAGRVALTAPAALLAALPRPSWWATGVLAAYTAVQYALLVLLPGRRFVAQLTPMGNRPMYRLNGVAAFVINVVAVVAAGRAGLLHPGVVYDRYGELLATAERHGGLSNGMAVSAAIQLLYIAKFFVWEAGYFNSIDITHDRFGFLICWGCLCWVPSVYTLPSMYMASRPVHLSAAGALGVLALGVVSVAANYDADRQRQRVRATNGATTVWGKPPVLVHAKYVTGDGRHHNNILLASGWWGQARHVNYLSELMLALAWTLPAGFDHCTPYVYVAFLTVLLVDRAERDDLRCRTKYGSYWSDYCARVPYSIVPYLY